MNVIIICVNKIIFQISLLFQQYLLSNITQFSSHTEIIFDIIEKKSFFL